MNINHYATEANDTLTVFRFTSSGPRGQIIKLIQLSPIDLPARKIDPGPAAGNPVCNLGFGDYRVGSSIPDDMAVSDNGDREIILATVAGAAYGFCHRYPSCWVYAQGSTPVRTRLYQMGLNRFYEDIVADFELFGYSAASKEWEIFQKDAPYSYTAFLIRLK